MSMYDCPECWNIVCDCGYEYKSWPDDAIVKQIEMLKRVLEEKAKAHKGPLKIKVLYGKQTKEDV